MRGALRIIASGLLILVLAGFALYYLATEYSMIIAVYFSVIVLSFGLIVGITTSTSRSIDSIVSNVGTSFIIVSIILALGLLLIEFEIIEKITGFLISFVVFVLVVVKVR